MTPGRKRGILIGGAVLVVAIVVAGLVVLNSGDEAPAAAGPATESGTVAGDPTSAITEYLQDFAEGNTDGASRLTDDPAAAAVALRDARNQLVPTKTTATLTKVQPTAAGATKTSGTFTVSWTLKPGKVWTYDDTFDVLLSGSGWRVHWAPTLLHPKLEAGQRLVLSTAAADTPVVVDRDGKPLVIAGAGGNRPVEGNPAPLLRPAFLSQAAAASGDGFAIARVDTAGKNVETLFGTASASGEVKPHKASLSLAAQNAAQAAVDGFKGSATLIALDASNGDILAVAQNAAAGDAPKAFSGLYAPGSSFKIVTATAAIENRGLTANSPVNCPLTDTIGTRTVSNEGFELGATTLQNAFARSCNTTFGALALDLPADALKKAADQYGLNADFEIPGISSELGKIEPPANKDEQVEDGFGQGRLQMSALGGAVMAATVRSGKAITPRLWSDVETTVVKSYSPPPGAALGTVRTLMRAVVTSGTAKAAASAGQVFGKTGTAQFGDGSQATGWFVGYRDNVAFAVMLEKSNDSGPAVSMAAKFLKAL